MTVVVLSETPVPSMVSSTALRSKVGSVTVTRQVFLLETLSLVAVTVTVAVPAATGCTVTVLPLKVTVAAAVLLLVTAKVASLSVVQAIEPSLPPLLRDRDAGEMVNDGAEAELTGAKSATVKVEVL